MIDHSTNNEVYFANISNIPILSKDKEISLMAEYKETNDKSVRNKLISSNLRLVIKIARKYSDKSDRFEFMDIVQQGNLGLMRSIEKFDISKGLRLTTYATFYIRQYISDYISGGTTTDKTTSRMDEVDERTLQSNVHANIVDKIDNKHLYEKMIAAVSRPKVLTENERNVIKRRFLSNKSITKTALAKEMGKSRQSIQQMEVAAITKLKKELWFVKEKYREAA